MTLSKPKPLKSSDYQCEHSFMRL